LALLSFPMVLIFSTAKEKITAGDNNELSFDIPNSVPSGVYSIRYFAVTDNNDTLWKKLELEVTSTDFSALQALTPSQW
jgi:ABC-type molybdate transport system substrate-binding protein